MAASTLALHDKFAHLFDVFGAITAWKCHQQSQSGAPLSTQFVSFVHQTLCIDMVQSYDKPMFQWRLRDLNTTSSYFSNFIIHSFIQKKEQPRFFGWNSSKSFGITSFRQIHAPKTIRHAKLFMYHNWTAEPDCEYIFQCYKRFFLACHVQYMVSGISATSLERTLHKLCFLAKTLYFWPGAYCLGKPWWL